MIAAIAQNSVVGRDNQLPWYLPEDLKNFKRLTLGKPILMGRLTYESIGRPLPGRTNIVVTRNKDYQAAGVTMVHDFAEALEVASDIALSDGAEELMVIGGAQIYSEALASADTLYLTEVHADIMGDAYFPHVDWDLWQESDRENFVGAASDSLDYSFVTYRRR